MCIKCGVICVNICEVSVSVPLAMSDSIRDPRNLGNIFQKHRKKIKQHQKFITPINITLFSHSTPITHQKLKHVRRKKSETFHIKRELAFSRIFGWIFNFHSKKCFFKMLWEHCLLPPTVQVLSLSKNTQVSQKNPSIVCGFDRLLTETYSCDVGQSFVSECFEKWDLFELTLLSMWHLWKAVQDRTTSLNLVTKLHLRY